MTLYIATHHHKYGQNTYVFDSIKKMEEEDFGAFLGEDYEPDPEAWPPEYIEIDLAEPISWPVEAA